jgi:hypothetical protein
VRKQLPSDRRAGRRVVDMLQKTKGQAKRVCCLNCDTVSRQTIQEGAVCEDTSKLETCSRLFDCGSGGRMNQPDGPSRDKLRDAAQAWFRACGKATFLMGFLAEQCVRRGIRACAVRTWWGVQVVRS